MVMVNIVVGVMMMGGRGWWNTVQLLVMQIWALDPHHLPAAVIPRWWKYLLFTPAEQQPQLHQHCNQILSPASSSRCKNQQSPAFCSSKHSDRSSREEQIVYLVFDKIFWAENKSQTNVFIILFSHWKGGGAVIMFLGPHFFGSPPTVGVPAMKAQRVPWVFSPPLTGHQINYPIYQREGKGPLPLSEIVFPNLFSNQILPDINLLILWMSWM